MSSNANQKPARSNQPPKGNKNQNKKNSQSNRRQGKKNRKQNAGSNDLQRIASATGTGIVSEKREGKKKVRIPRGMSYKQQWVDMMVNQDADQVLAPNSSPVMTSMAPATHSLDFKQGEGLYPVGPTMVMQRSAVRGAIYATSLGVPDGLGDRDVKFNASVTVANNVVVAGLVNYSDPNGFQKVTKLVPFPPGNVSIPVDCASGDQPILDISISHSATNTGTSHKVDFEALGAGPSYTQFAELGTQEVPVHPKSLRGTLETAPGDLTKYISCLPADSTTQTYTLRIDGSYHGKFPDVGANAMHLDAFSSDWIKSVDPDGMRVTAAHMLVSDFTAAVYSAGECIMARIPERMIEEATDIIDLKARIKRLPERTRWRSAHAREGGYVWWMPQQADDYSFGDDTAFGHDLCNVAIFDLTENGYFRVQATWKFEFYTTDQTRSKSVTPMFSPELLAQFHQLALLPAVSSNLNHEELVQYIAKAAHYLHTAYKVGSTVLEAGTMLAALF
jgi:hypothetical protein